MENRTQPLPYMLYSTTDGQFQTAVVPTSKPTDLLKIAQMAQVDKLKGLCATVEVLESDVICLRKDVATLMVSPLFSNPNLPEPVAVTSQLEAPKSPPDDWWVGCDTEMVFDEEIYHSRPSPPPMLTVREVDPSWKPSGEDTTLYHGL
ncbi:hypothetical protein HAX54_040159 [Datura stramonium]|uniref:Uncharacterized protein n=1 Tax=Datura stramonium TaxID=4076 RepID=A0ABS8VMA1_DATST|nr:hypothetical protein [Datura stramonium]